MDTAPCGTCFCAPYDLPTCEGAHRDRRWSIVCYCSQVVSGWRANFLFCRARMDDSGYIRPPDHVQDHHWVRLLCFLYCIYACLVWLEYIRRWSVLKVSCCVYFTMLTSLLYSRTTSQDILLFYNGEMIRYVSIAGRRRDVKMSKYVMDNLEAINWQSTACWSDIASRMMLQTAKIIIRLTIPEAWDLRDEDG